jgi:hypothetical protein
MNSIIPTQATFADYFKLTIYLDEILAYFGFSLDKNEQTFPQGKIVEERTEQLKQRIRENLPLISLNNETAKREFLIAPVLMEVLHYTRSKLKTEFPINVNEQLKGNLDYYLEGANNLLIIEAKNTDLESGFTQLAVELIALNQITSSKSNKLYGAVSTGNIWQFVILEREQKRLIQDLTLLRVPNDLDILLPILVGILT